MFTCAHCHGPIATEHGFCSDACVQLRLFPEATVVDAAAAYEAEKDLRRGYDGDDDFDLDAAVEAHDERVEDRRRARR
jgi:hypothetical protein